ncbi:MAG TPA: sigma-70 family RNA polymerase sigma factor [Actinomycetota bacterium]|nr:sigma-70 family RNA polymerase sigma factor [Actinomycetota bacterium]
MGKSVPSAARDPFALPQVANEQRTFENFFEAESGPLYQRVCLITGNRHEAEEIMQDAFLIVFERWGRVRSMEDPTGYLYRVALNALRKRARRAALALRQAIHTAPRQDQFEAVDDRDLVARALSGLSRRQRAALVLTELLGYPSEAAGKLLGVSAGTVRALASQGRAALRATMERLDG